MLLVTDNNDDHKGRLPRVLTLIRTLGVPRYLRLGTSGVLLRIFCRNTGTIKSCLRVRSGHGGYARLSLIFSVL